MRKISDLIRDRNPLILSPNVTVRCACQLMRERRTGAALVASHDHELKGIFTRGDAVNRVLAEGRSAVKTTLGQVMTADLRTVSPATTAIEALRIMEDCGCRHLPVISDGKILGVIFRGDFKGIELDLIEEEAKVWERIR
jgi:CBS domain-containing protein